MFSALGGYTPLWPTSSRRPCPPPGSPESRLPGALFGLFSERPRRFRLLFIGHSHSIIRDRRTGTRPRDSQVLPPGAAAGDATRLRERRRVRPGVGVCVAGFVWQRHASPLRPGSGCACRLRVGGGDGVDDAGCWRGGTTRAMESTAHAVTGASRHVGDARRPTSLSLAVHGDARWRDCRTGRGRLGPLSRAHARFGKIPPGNRAA